MIGGSGAGALDADLEAACRRALAIPAASCTAFARRFSWEACAEQFLDNLRPLSPPALASTAGA